MAYNKTLKDKLLWIMIQQYSKVYGLGYNLGA